MCLLCHNAMSDETVKKQLQEALEDPQFEVWNMTSISHIMLSMSGMNGFEVAYIAQELFRNYIGWHKERSDNETAIKSLEITLGGFETIIQKAQENGYTDEQLKEAVKKTFHEERERIKII